jgi:hypothetical protein
MHRGFWLRPVLAGALVALGCAPAARGADDPKKEDDHSQRAVFTTVDGVDLDGTFYPAEPDTAAGAKAKEAVVLLLHNIDKSGGSSRQEGWPELAMALQKEGYAVLAFDFRGFGNSRNVAKEFWDPAINPYVRHVKGAHKAKPPATIDHKDFDANAAEFYPSLVNDVAAAKAFLDRKNDRAVNTSNLILVGAGEGATIGALWVEMEWHRRKVKALGAKGLPVLDEPEGRDVAAAVWLSLSPKLGGKDVALHTWLADAAAENKVPTSFIYGEKDEAAAASQEAWKAVERGVRKQNAGLTGDKLETALKEEMYLDRDHPVEGTSLTGSKLLTADGVSDWIVKKYLKAVMDKRGPKEFRKREDKDDAFLWTFPGAPSITAKKVGEDNLRVAPVDAAKKANGS